MSRLLKSLGAEVIVPTPASCAPSMKMIASATSSTPVLGARLGLTPSSTAARKPSTTLQPRRCASASTSLDLGVRLPAPSTSSFVKAPRLPPELLKSLEVIDELSAQIKELDKKIIADITARQSLQQVAGVGPVTA